MDMTFFGIWWLWWMLGTFGLVGTVLLLWLAPAMLAQIVRVSLTFFITNRAGNIIAAAVIAFFIADTNRSIRDEHEYAAKTAQFQQDQKDRDNRIAQETRDDVWKDIAEATSNNSQIDNQVEDIHDALPPIPDGTANPFLVGTSSCKLRALAGQPGCGPEGTSGVPKAGTPAKPAANHRRFRLPGSVGRILGRDPKGTAGNKGA